MKGNRMYVDIGSMLDEVFEAAKTFGDQIKDNFGPDGKIHNTNPWFNMDQEENADWYPSYSYPPMNIYLTKERAIVLELALSGFDEKDISLTFQGDYMVFSAIMNLETVDEEGVRYFKRRLKLKDIDKQKYYVPADKFDQLAVRAVFKNGILKVVVPPRETSQTTDGIKIEIVKEGV